MSIDVEEGKKEAVKTYIEQTKLLVALASAFVLAPAAAVAVFKDRLESGGLTGSQLSWFVIANILFITSVLMGYIVLGTIAGYQHLNRYDVYRPATKWASLLQIVSYLLGLAVFIILALALGNASIKKIAFSTTESLIGNLAAPYSTAVTIETR